MRNQPKYALSLSLLVLISAISSISIACTIPEDTNTPVEPVPTSSVQESNVNMATLENIWAELTRISSDLENTKLAVEQLKYDADTALFETQTTLEAIQNTSFVNDENISGNIESQIQDLITNIDSLNASGFIEEHRWTEDMNQLNVQLEDMASVIESLGYDSQLQLTDKVNDLNSQLEEIWRSIETIEFDLETSSQTSYIDSRIDEINTQLIELTSSVHDELSYRIDSLEYEIQTSDDTEDINTLQLEINEVRSSIPYNLQASLDSLNSQVISIMDTIDTNKYLSETDIQNVRSELLYLEDRINSMN
ncbi:MAG: hypothetical protein MK028_06970 [Dehalococcoidia bacterium]|nr:hypothetical protein [Dehalococcoidia bacterium]